MTMTTIYIIANIAFAIIITITLVVGIKQIKYLIKDSNKNS